MALAVDNEPLRQALYSIAAAHKLTITKDSSYCATELQYKVRAIKGMIALINGLSRKTKSTQDSLVVLESLLGCAVLLSWYSTDR